jgi:hypothetical protein
MTYKIYVTVNFVAHYLFQASSKVSCILALQKWACHVIASVTLPHFKHFLIDDACKACCWPTFAPDLKVLVDMYLTDSFRDL